MRYKISYFGIYEDHLLLPVFLFRMIRVFMIYSWGLTLRFFCPRKVQGFYRQEILWVFYLFILCVGEGGGGGWLNYVPLTTFERCKSSKRNVPFVKTKFETDRR